MQPVWIKYGGLIWMTKRGYLVTLVMTVVVGVIVIAFYGFAGLLPPIGTMWQPDAGRAPPGFLGWVYNYLWWIVLACAVALAIDAVVVLKRFARKEAEQRVAEEQKPARSV